jgi:DNA polymerase/3'-5' exonuclease PolX
MSALRDAIHIVTGGLGSTRLVRPESPVQHECAGALREIAVVLAQEGAPVTSRSEYARGAQAEEALAQDVAHLARTSRLQSVLGIGPTLADPSPN